MLRPYDRTRSGHHQVHELVRHDNSLYHMLAINVSRNGRITERHGDKFGFAESGNDLEGRTYASVNLHDNLDLLIFREFGIKRGPRSIPKAVIVTKHYPELFGEMRRHGSKHQGHELEHFFSHFRPHWLVYRFLNFVGQFHDLCDGRVKVPSRLKVLSDTTKRLVRPP